MGYIRIKTNNYLAILSNGKMYEIEAENAEKAKEKMCAILRKRNIECDVSIAQIPSCIGIIG